jgi:hypothetical protein
VSGSLGLEWTDREPPLAPAGLVALGPDATLLAERLSRLEASVTKHLLGVISSPLPPAGYPLGGGDNEESDSLYSPRPAGVRGETGGILALLGPHDWLPWSPGVIYLAPDPNIPTLFLPTTKRPTLPPALVLAALTRRFPELRPPLALLPDCCFSLTDASPILGGQGAR